KDSPAAPLRFQNESFSVTAGRDAFGPVVPELLPNPPGGVPAIVPLPMFVPAEKNTPFPRFVVLNMPPAVPCPNPLPGPLPPAPIASRNVNLKVPIEELRGREKLVR